MHNQLEQAGRIKTALARLFKAVKSDLEKRLHESGCGLTPLQYAVLRLLKPGNFTISELSKIMRIEPPTLVPVIEFLDEKKLIQRQSDPDDRRRSPLHLTAAGKKILVEVPYVTDDDFLVQAINKLGHDQTNELVRRLEQLTEEIT